MNTDKLYHQAEDTSIQDRWGGVLYIFGSETFVKTYIFLSNFSLFKIIFLGSHLAVNLNF